MTLNYSAIAPESIKDTPLPSVVAGSISLGGVNAPNESVDVSPQVIQDAQIPNDVPASDIISAALNTQTRRILGNFTFESLGAISIGQIKISPVGILGQDTGGVTTFSLDPTTGAAYFKGTVAAGSIVTGYIAVGGAAGDVNGGSTKIQGGQIVTGSIYATQIAASAGITAGQLSVSQLSAIAANLGTITAGTINGVTIQLPNESLATGTAGKLIWASNARIWGDTSGRLGFYSAGPASDGMYFYPNATESVIFNSGGQAVFHYGIHLDNSSNLNIDGSMACNSIRLSQSAVENNITDINIIKGYNDVNLQLGNDTYYISFYNTGFTQVAYIDSSGNIHKNGTVSFDIPHPVKDGYRLKYPSVEAPEVALQLRGIAKLINGVAKITTPDHWALVTEEALTTVVLTALEKTKGLYVPKETLTITEFEVRSVDPEEQDTEFMWQLTAVRKGYKDFQAEYPNQEGHKFRLAQEKHWKGEMLNDVEKELLKDILPRKREPIAVV